MAQEPINDTIEPQEQAEGAEPHGDTTDWKAEARKWEKRARENKTAADELAAIREAGKTELEKAQDALAKEKQRADALQTEKDQREWRESISEETGIPAKLLHGATLEEMRESAEALKPYFEKADSGYVPSDGKKAPNAPGASTDPIRALFN